MTAICGSGEEKVRERGGRRGIRGGVVIYRWVRTCEGVNRGEQVLIQNGDAADKCYQTSEGRFGFQNFDNTYQTGTVNSVFFFLLFIYFLFLPFLNNLFIYFLDAS